MDRQFVKRLMVFNPDEGDKPLIILIFGDSVTWIGLKHRVIQRLKTSSCCQVKPAYVLKTGMLYLSENVSCLSFHRILWHVCDLWRFCDFRFSVWFRLSCLRTRTPMTRLFPDLKIKHCTAVWSSGWLRVLTPYNQRLESFRRLSSWVPVILQPP